MAMITTRHSRLALTAALALSALLLLAMASCRTGKLIAIDGGEAYICGLRTYGDNAYPEIILYDRNESQYGPSQ